MRVRDDGGGGGAAAATGAAVGNDSCESDGMFSDVEVLRGGGGGAAAAAVSLVVVASLGPCRCKKKIVVSSS